MPVERVYLSDTFKFELDTAISRAEVLDNGDVDVVTEQTVFHPQGGGQPADKGTMTISDSSSTLRVKHVRSEGDEVVHTVEGGEGAAALAAGARVLQRVDSRARLFHAKLHSAGHIMDCAMRNIGRGGMKAGKASHLPESCWVEYIGIVPADERESVKRALEEECNKLIEADVGVDVETVSFTEAAERLGEAPDYLPRDRPVRIVTYDGLGGTHVQRTGQVDKVRITKLKAKSGRTKVYYELVGGDAYDGAV